MVKVSNSRILSVDKDAIKRKRRNDKDRVEEIKFDDDSRREFLTGFRKRKQKRIQDRREKAKQREKEEKKRRRKEENMVNDVPVS